MNLCEALDLSPARLYHLGQDNYFEDGIQENEAMEEKDGDGNGAIRMEQLTESFLDLTSHGEVKTKAEVKAFPTIPCEIRLNSENHIWPPGGKSADDNNNSGKDDKSNKQLTSEDKKKHCRNNPPSVAPTLRRPTCATHAWNNLTTRQFL